MQLKFENLNKPSNKSFKKIADFLLYTLPLYLGAVMSLPISDTIKLWITFGFTIITVTIKGITKFTAEESTGENPAQ